MQTAMEYLYKWDLGCRVSPAGLLLSMFPISVDFSDAPEKKERLCEIAWMLTQSGETREAIELLLLGVHAAPRDARLWLFLDELLRRADLGTVAKRCRAAGLAFDTDQKVVERIEAQIEKRLDRHYPVGGPPTEGQYYHEEVGSSKPGRAARSRSTKKRKRKKRSGRVSRKSGDR